MSKEINPLTILLSLQVILGALEDAQEQLEAMIKELREYIRIYPERTK